MRVVVADALADDFALVGGQVTGGISAWLLLQLCGRELALHECLNFRN